MDKKDFDSLVYLQDKIHRELSNIKPVYATSIKPGIDGRVKVVIYATKLSTFMKKLGITKDMIEIEWDEDDPI